MADNRTIIIDADAKGAEKGMETLRVAGEKMYDEIKGKAEQYSGELHKQAEKVEDLIQTERKRLAHVIEGNRLELDMQTKLALARLDPRVPDYEERKRKILEQQRQKLQEINQEYKEQKRVISEAAKVAEDEYGDVEGPAAGGGGGGRRGRGMGLTQAALAGSVAGLVSSITIMGNSLRPIGTLIGAAGQLEGSQRSLRAMTGREAGFAGAAAYGVSTAEYAAIQREVARVSGRGGAGLEGRTRDMLMTEKAFGLDQGQLLGLTQFERMGADAPMQLVQTLAAKAANSKLWDIELDGKGQIKGFASLGQTMESMSTLMEREAEISETFSGQRSADVLTAFGTLGGGFEDRRGLGRIMALDEAIKGGGGNEFMQAEIMGAISANDPTLGLVGVRQRMAQGVFGEGNLAAVLERAQQIGGKGGETTQAFLMALAPQLAGNVEALQTLSMADPNMFRGKSSEQMSELMKQYGLTKGRISGRATEAVGGVEAMDTAIQDSMAEIGLKMTRAIEEPLKDFAEGLLDFAGDPTGFVSEMWSNAVDSVTEGFGNMIDSVEQKMENMWNSTVETITAPFEALGEKFDSWNIFSDENPVPKKGSTNSTK